MTEEQQPVPEQEEKPSLDELVQKRKQELLAKKSDKKVKDEQKQRIEKQEKRATITIIQKAEPSVIIENLPRVEETDVKELVFKTIGVKDVPVERHGPKWSVMLKFDNKRRQLVDKLDGSFCKESGKDLRVYIK